jgi:predicted nucleic acid-binding protein
VKQDVQEKVLFYVHSKATLITLTIAVEQSRDAKDNFLLELSEVAHADYLITRDYDLLVIKGSFCQVCKTLFFICFIRLCFERENVEKIG